MYYEQKNYVKAIDMFSKEIKLNPRASSYHFLANSLKKSGRAKESIEQYVAAIRLSPENADLFIDLGAAYHEVGQIKESMKALSRAVELEPGNHKARSFLGVSKFLLGDERGAIEQYAWLLERDPKLAAEMMKGFEELSAAARDTKKPVKLN
jgi:tetratricopeptide (TPR) repeat protein